MRSPCCDALIMLAMPYTNDPGETNWFACTACGQPCDPVEMKEDK